MQVNQDPSNIIIFIALLSLLPIIVVLTTSFLKVSMVLILTRESLGVQQVPPNIVIYGLSLILAFYIMGPVYSHSVKALTQNIVEDKPITSKVLIENYDLSINPIKQFLIKQTHDNEREFFYQALGKFWTAEMYADVKKNDLIILVPAFVVNELTQAFKIGFLIYLPSVIIDIIVSNILMAMGMMMMMSPVTISLPIKLLLFISLDGWSRLIHILLGTYV
jgi:type III secretion protein R